MMEVRFADAQTWAIYVTQKRSAVRMGWVFLDWFFVQTGDGTTVIVGVSASAEVAGQAWHCSQRVGETMCAAQRCAGCGSCQQALWSAVKPGTAHSAWEKRCALSRVSGAHSKTKRRNSFAASQTCSTVPTWK